MIIILNLFFNEQTDYNKPFCFEDDFTFLFPQTSHSTKEIKITIIFDIPDTYSESGAYSWTKIWRTDGYFDESILTDNAYEIVNNPEIDIVAELIGGVEPAFELIKKATHLNSLIVLLFFLCINILAY